MAVDLSTFVMNGGYTIEDAGTDYVIRYLIGAPAGAAAEPATGAAPVVGAAPGVGAAPVAPVAAPATQTVAAPVVLTTGTGITLAGIQPCPFIEKYYQPQETGLGCGRFALNNLLHYQKFTMNPTVENPPAYPADTPTADIITNATANFTRLSTLDNINLQEVCVRYEAVLERTLGELAYGCPAYENFDSEVLIVALNTIGLGTDIAIIEGNDIVVTDKITGAPMSSSTKKDLLGYIMNPGGNHWLCLRKLPIGVENAGDFQYINTFPTGVIETFKSIDAFLNKYGKSFVRIIEVLNFTKAPILPSIIDDYSKGLVVESSAAAPSPPDMTKLLITFVNKEYPYASKEFKDKIAAYIKLIGKGKIKEFVTVVRSIITTSEFYNFIETTSSVDKDIIDAEITRLFTIIQPGIDTSLKNDIIQQIKAKYSEKYKFIGDEYLNAKTVDDLLKMNTVLAANVVRPLGKFTNQKAIDVAIAGSYKNPTTGGSRRKTLRLQARQKPGRRALSHKQVHHKENENP